MQSAREALNRLRLNCVRGADVGPGHKGGRLRMGAAAPNVGRARDRISEERRAANEEINKGRAMKPFEIMALLVTRR